MAQVVVTRHADAGNRHQWTGDDRRRPLSPKGWRQAQGLVDLLGPFPFTELRSSPYARCRQTLEPVAEARGLVVLDDDDLAEGGGLEPVLDAAVRRGQGACWGVCTHGDVLGELLQQLVDRRLLDVGQVVLRKGGSWVLEVAPSGVVGARYLPAPEA